MSWISNFTMQGISFLTTAFVMAVGLFVLAIFIMFIIDVSQTKDAVRRNYPVVGRFRGLFTELGEFFRQYFFAMDREEMPLNRAERDWVYKSSKGEDNTVAFGSTRSLIPVGTPIFVNCPFPTLDEDAEEVPELVVGAMRPHPYRTRSIVNISGMKIGRASCRERV